MWQLQWDRKFITKVRAGLSVAVAAMIARKKESLHRKAEEEGVCAYSSSSEEMWPRIIQVNV